VEQQVEANSELNQATFVIAGWTVEPAALRISREDETVKLEPKVMAVLEYLAARAGTVVSRQELEEKVWAGTVVGYDAISNAIIKLRKAFGDSAQNATIIETIPKTGYRLIASVTPTDDKDASAAAFQAEPNSSDDAQAPPTRQTALNRLTFFDWRISAYFMILVMVAVAFWLEPWRTQVEPASIEQMQLPLPDKPSIAVLPFANLSADPEQEYFVDGMTEDLIIDLSKLSGLFVVARNSVFFYKNKKARIRDVAEALGVRYVFEGSVRLAGVRVRINAQLIDALSGDHVWAETYDGVLGDVFDIQDKITQRIVNALEISLTHQEQINKAEIETKVPKAYEAFLRGWERYRLGTPEDLVKAIPQFEKALALDPNYARASSALASTYWTILSHGWRRHLNLRSTEIITNVRQHLAKAMERPTPLTYQLASERAAVLYPKAAVALAEAERAIALDANDPAGHLAMAAALINDGRSTEAVESIRMAMRLDPLYPTKYLALLGQAQFAAGRYEQAAETFELAAERNPDNDWTAVYLAATYGQLGRKDKGARALRRASELRAQSGWGELTLLMLNPGKSSRYYSKWFGDYKPLREGLLKSGIKTGLEWRNHVSFRDLDFTVKDAIAIDVEAAKSLHDRGVLFIDVHYFWHEQRIPGAEFLDMWAFEFNEVRLSQIADKTQELVIYSSHSHDGKWLPQSVALAVSWGYEKVYYFKNGLEIWKQAGYPVETDKKKY
jgi:TolB-like protein/DNA-binding winged helix-turn-helix (wHTH) protein/Flp pilus assembly protein TadD